MVLHLTYSLWMRLPTPFLVFLLGLPAAFFLGSCGAPATEAPVQAPGTARMAQRLAAISETTSPMDNTFMNHERLALFRQQAEPQGVADKARLGIRQANEALFAGENEAAVEKLAQLVELSAQHPQILGPRFQRAVRSQLATAYLRLGEQANCIEHHSLDACLLPIQGHGIHQFQEGSRAALEILAELLREDPSDLTSRWLYNVAAMTVDEYPDSVPVEWLIPPDAFESEADIGRFLDGAPTAGLAASGLAGGSVVDDLNGDGHLDVIASSWGLQDQIRLFINQGNGTFLETTAESGLTGLTGGLNLVHADYDNDGDNDIFVLRGAWLGAVGAHPNSLLENQGVHADGYPFFEDVTEKVGLLSFHPTQTAAWADYNNDGWVDLFIGNESQPGLDHPCELYRNNGPGTDGTFTFTNVAQDLGLGVLGFVKAAVWGDVDNDGLQDLYLSRMMGANLLFHNQGETMGWKFREIGRAAGVAQPQHSFPAWFFDFDNDGYLDIFVSGYLKSYVEGRATDVAADYLGLPISMEHPRLYRNEGAKGTVKFTDVTVAAGLDHALMSMGANFGDLDNDGFLDLYLGTGAPDYRALVPNRMFRNNAGTSFQDITTSGGFGHLQKGHAISFADIDNDGDQDVYAVMGGAYSGDIFQNALFVNPGHGNSWITLRLEGTRSNRSAIGARLRLEIETPDGPRQIHRVVSSGGSFGASSLQQEIGLGNATAIRVLEIRWPGGATDTHQNLSINQTLDYREGSK